MKKSAITVFLFASIVFILSSCSGDGGNGYDIKMRLNKGDKFSQNTEMDMDMNMTIAGMAKDMKMKMSTGSSFEVGDSSAAGKDVKITYNKMNIKMDMGLGAGVNTDSIMNQTTKGIIGKSVVITLAHNKITDVKGFDSLSVNSGDTASVKLMQKMFSKESLNNAFGIMFNIYPNKKVKEGESWTADNIMDVSGMNMKVKTKYTLLRVKNDIAEISIEGTIDSKGNMTQGGMNVDMDMKGTQKGKMNIKLSDGYLSSGNYDMDIEAGMNIMGQKMPLKMKAIAVMTGE